MTQRSCFIHLFYILYQEDKYHVNVLNMTALCYCDIPIKLVYSSPKPLEFFLKHKQ